MASHPSRTEEYRRPVLSSQLRSCFPTFSNKPTAGTLFNLHQLGQNRYKAFLLSAAQCCSQNPEQPALHSMLHCLLVTMHFSSGCIAVPAQTECRVCRQNAGQLSSFLDSECLPLTWWPRWTRPAWQRHTEPWLLRIYPTPEANAMRRYARKRSLSS